MPDHLRNQIRSIPDFPKKGILYRDITTLLKNPQAFRAAIDLFVDRYKDAGVQKIVSIESRGFVIGSPLAYRLSAGLVPVRKPHKLPAEKLSQAYALEYGTDTLEIHCDSITPGEKVLIIDDLLATGGTARAACALVERLGGRIAGCGFLIELSFLHGRDQLHPHDVFTIIDYPDENDH